MSPWDPAPPLRSHCGWSFPSRYGPPVVPRPRKHRGATATAVSLAGSLLVTSRWLAEPPRRHVPAPAAARPRHPSAMTSSFLQGAFVGTRERGKNGLAGLRQTSEARASPRQGAAPSLPAAWGGRLKGAAWRRLKAKQLLIYNVAKREIVAKKDKDAGIAGILQSL